MNDEIAECRKMLVIACEGTAKASLTEPGPTVIKWADTVTAWAEKLSELEGRRNRDKAGRWC